MTLHLPCKIRLEALRKIGGADNPESSMAADRKPNPVRACLITNVTDETRPMTQEEFIKYLGVLVARAGSQAKLARQLTSHQP